MPGHAADVPRRVPRRALLKGGLAASLSAVPLAMLLADPRLARAAAATTQTVSLTTPGGRTVAAALARPDASPAPAVLLIHEWWGLNDQIKSVAADFARHGYVALAVDLFDGAVATTADQAKAQVAAVDAAAATETLTAWIAWLRVQEAVAKRDGVGQVATIGWCFGGGWSLNASIAAPVDATVIYYGRVDRPREDLARLHGPVLGHFATQDQWINQDMVGQFAAHLEALGHPHEIHWYDAPHAFANPTTSRYDAEDAVLAWRRTQAFLAATLGAG